MLKNNQDTLNEKSEGLKSSEKKQFNTRHDPQVLAEFGRIIKGRGFTYQSFMDKIVNLTVHSGDFLYNVQNNYYGTF